MSNTFTRTFITTIATVGKLALDTETKQPKVVETVEVSIAGNATEEQLVKLARKTLGKMAACIVMDTRTSETLYAMKVETFLKYAKVVSIDGVKVDANSTEDTDTEDTDTEGQEG